MHICSRFVQTFRSFFVHFVALSVCLHFCSFKSHFGSFHLHWSRVIFIFIFVVSFYWRHVVFRVSTQSKYWIWFIVKVRFHLTLPSSTFVLREWIELMLTWGEQFNYQLIKSPLLLLFLNVLVWRTKWQKLAFFSPVPRHHLFIFSD